MQLQLYIEDKLVELYKDETIEINETIKDVREIDKLKTNFTRQFNVPASDVNNNTFKHFYNFMLTDGFDARIRVNAELRYNGFVYRKGKARIDGVKMKNNVASSYKVVFFGNGIDFKNTFKEDQIDALPFLSEQNHDYNRESVLDGFQNGYTDGVLDVNPNPKIIYPFITHTKGYTYDNNVIELDASGQVGTNEFDWRELKPAIKIPTILEAIEQKYNINFQGVILDDSRFENMYMWLHRNSGNIQTVEGVKKEISREDFSLINGEDAWDENPFEIFETSAGNGDEFRKYDFTLTIEPAGNDTSYDVVIRNKLVSGTLFTFDNLSGNQTINFVLEGGGLGTLIDLEIMLFVNAGVTSFDVDVKVEKQTQVLVYNNNTGQEQPVFTSELGQYVAPNFVPLSIINVDLQMPKIKVIDFLNGLFKMFNLLFIFDGQTITLFTFNDWLQLGKTIDVTEYIDITNTEVKRIAPYTQLIFQHEENKTFFAENFSKLFNREFAELKYDVHPDFDGITLDVKSGFEVMLYERMRRGDNTTTDIGWGWSVDDKQAPYIGKPLLFYHSKQPTPNTTFSTSYDGSNVNIAGYNRPRNSEVASFTTSLLWNAENDYYNGQRMSNSLFKTYWSEYLERLFSKQARLIQFKAILPIDFMLNYQLNDKLKIGSFVYFINDIRMDLTTGDASLNLIPDVNLLLAPDDDRLDNGLQMPQIVLDYFDRVNVDLGNVLLSKSQVGNRLSKIAIVDFPQFIIDYYLRLDVDKGEPFLSKTQLRTKINNLIC